MMRSPSLSSSSSKPAAIGNSSGDATPCCSSKVVGLKRGPWTAEEDQLLSGYIKRNGEGRWSTLPAKAGLLRCGKSCRLRWMNYLRPSVKRGHITADEEDLILRLHRLLGNRWSLIAGRIPGRTDNEIKNYWNTHLSKKLISQGINPKTHKPLINPNQHPSMINNNKRSSSKPTSNPNYAPLASENGEDDLQKDSRHDGDDHDDTSHEDDMINNYCTDEAFSSFLNSLINDDMFNVNQLQQDDDQQHQPSNLIIGLASDDEPMVSCDQWDMSSSMASGPNCTSEPKVPSDRVDDQ